MNLNVIILVGVPSDVPAEKLLLNIDLSEHLTHLLMIDVINEPHSWCLGILIKGQGIGIGQLIDSIDVLPQESPDDSLVPLSADCSLEVIHD